LETAPKTYIRKKETSPGRLRGKESMLGYEVMFEQEDVIWLLDSSEPST
jgi:hypothetical protein